MRKLLGASSPCTGTVPEATLQLLPIVLAARPLPELVASGMVELTPLARSVGQGTSGGSRVLSTLYEEMQRQVAAASPRPSPNPNPNPNPSPSPSPSPSPNPIQVAAVLAQRPTHQPSTGSRLYVQPPTGLFHVALDWPGRGRSPGDARAMDARPEARAGRPQPRPQP